MFHRTHSGNKRKVRGKKTQGKEYKICLFQVPVQASPKTHEGIIVFQWISIGITGQSE